MHKMVNGERVEMTPEEEAAITAEWEANRKKPRAVPQPSPEARLAALESEIAALKTGRAGQ